MSCIRSTDCDSALIDGRSKKSFASAALRRLGCSSSASSDAFAPSAATDAATAVRSSAEWRGKRSRRRRRVEQLSRSDISTTTPTNSSNKKERRGNQHHHPPPHRHHQDSDVWYSPGFPDDSMDCVARHHSMMMMMNRGGRHDAELIHREIMMLQSRMTSGRMNVYDRYRDWRLDVDRMSYEELLELGDRIGHVNTGLREEEISCSLRKIKHSILDASPLFFCTEMEKKCSICQEEYEVNDEIGKLECGHSYHMCCIKQWLLQKNACPVCKTAVTRN